MKNIFRYFILVVFIFAVTGVAFYWGYAEDTENKEGYSFSDKVVLAYYYIWFTKTSFESGGDLPEAMKDIHPTIGSYDSHDPKVVEEHVKMARRAKIDAFAVSWWFDDSENGMNDKLELVFEKSKLHGLKVSIDLEAEPMNRKEIYKCLKYYLTKYKDNPESLKVEGKPVVVIWGTWKHSPEDWGKIFNKLEEEKLFAFYIVSGQLDEAYLGPFRGLEQYALVDNNDEGLPEFYQRQKKKIERYNKTYPENPAQWHATIMPGFDERGIPGREEEGGAGWKERKDGEYYKMTFEAALASKPDWIHITSFNELAEHTHIEPTKEFGWKYIDLTAEFVDKFKGK